MAIKRESSSKAKAPAPKKTKATGAAKKTTTSRGSKTIKQTGDMNQRESYAANRSKDVKGIMTTRGTKYAADGTRYKPGTGSKNSSSDYSKVSKAEASGTYGGVKEARKVRNQQRAGGKGK